MFSINSRRHWFLGGCGRAELIKHCRQIGANCLGVPAFDAMPGDEVDQLAILEKSKRRRRWRDIGEIVTGSGGCFEILSGKDRQKAIRLVGCVLERQPRPWP